MIDISIGKMIVLALIALIVLGPEKLPGAARTVGALLRRARNGWDSVRTEVERELQIEEIRRAAREATSQAQSAQSGFNDTVQKVREPFTLATSAFQAAPIGPLSSTAVPAADGQPVGAGSANPSPAASTAASYPPAATAPGVAAASPPHAPVNAPTAGMPVHPAAANASGEPHPGQESAHGGA